MLGCPTLFTQGFYIVRWMDGIRLNINGKLYLPGCRYYIRADAKAGNGIRKFNACITGTL